MKEFDIKVGQYGRLRFILGSSYYGWDKSLGLGITYQSTHTGTTYREPGSNKAKSIHIMLGSLFATVRYTYKDMTENRADDPESAYYAQTHL